MKLGSSSTLDEICSLPNVACRSLESEDIKVVSVEIEGSRVLEVRSSPRIYEVALMVNPKLALPSFIANAVPSKVIETLKSISDQKGYSYYVICVARSREKIFVTVRPQEEAEHLLLATITQNNVIKHRDKLGLDEDTIKSIAESIV